MKVLSRRYLVYLLDLLFVAVSYLLAVLLRFDFWLDGQALPYVTHMLPILLVCRGITFLLSRLYRCIWKYASLSDGVEILKIVSISSLVSLCAILALHEQHYFSRVIFILDWAILFWLMASSRLVWRVYREMFVISSDNRDGPRTLVVGAGEIGNELVREIRKSPRANYNVVGFVDEDPARHGLSLSGIPVLGDTSQLSRLAREMLIENVIIALPSARGKVVRAIVRRCRMAGVRFQILPGLSDLITGKVEVSRIKNVDVEDLLGREPATLDVEAISAYLKGKRVLVSGSAGSIGSEICRQVARFGPRKIILLDAAETPLYQIEHELAEAWPDIILVPVLADVRNKERIRWVFEEFRPDVVFHAAAYKHVPMMEFNPLEAVTNNVRGSMQMADMADRFGVTNFVMVSTDKAVNPTNVMGASKRAAECYVQSLSKRSRTKFTTVRFGNVLGSNGSVIPRFKEQIMKGGPVTITDPRINRFFMTIPEASQLVLQASCLGSGGEIFLLDMGEPVLILELAEQLISLSGLEPYEDIDITFTGLRPGEKLYEELLIDGEGVLPTSHDMIRVQSPVDIDARLLMERLASLCRSADENDVAAVMRCLKKVVPEFSPHYAEDDDLPPFFTRVRPDLATLLEKSEEVAVGGVVAAAG
jgi:FlaA1/EpsC-like NDP-sugar epimerase